MSIAIGINTTGRCMECGCAFEITRDMVNAYRDQSPETPDFQDAPDSEIANLISVCGECSGFNLRPFWRVTGWNGNAANFDVVVRAHTSDEAKAAVRRIYRHGQPWEGTGNKRRVLVYSCTVAAHTRGIAQ